MDMIAIINQLETLSLERRQELAQRWQSSSLTESDREELKHHVAIALVQVKDQKLAREIHDAMTTSNHA